MNYVAQNKCLWTCQLVQRHRFITLGKAYLAFFLNCIVGIDLLVIRDLKFTHRPISLRKM